MRFLPERRSAAPGDVGFEGLSHAGTSTPTGTKRAESVLWFNDGSWWANMWDTVSSDFHIFRLNRSTQQWVDTGVRVDARANTNADVLWDGAHLYVSSHTFVNDEQAAVSGFPSYLYRFSYNAITKTYSLDPGFPAQINNYKTETLTVDKDSTGKLWATWQQGNRIYMNRTTGSDASWGTPFELPTASPVTVDDNSALIAFAGRIGVLWSDQTTTNDGMHFSIHRDGDPDGVWSGRQAAIQGPASGDDHMNLKSLDASGGRVYAAVKTSFTSASAPLIMLLVYDISAGTWQSYTIARVSDCPNRVLVLVDPENGLLHTFATYPAPPNFACSSSGGAIYEKTSPLNAISFPTGRGTLRILDADSPFVHNVSSTKQNVTNASGIAILADNGNKQRYRHHFDPLGGAPPPGAPTAGFTATPTSGPRPLRSRSPTPPRGARPAGPGTSATAARRGSEPDAHLYLGRHLHRPADGLERHGLGQHDQDDHRHRVAAATADRELHRDADERDRAAERGLYRYVDGRPDQLVLGLRRRRLGVNAEPDAHLHIDRHAHRHADGRQRRGRGLRPRRSPYRRPAAR